MSTFEARQAGERKGLRTPTHEAGWTDARVEQLKQLWKAGQSCSQIAWEMGGGLTRNGVISKVHRLKLPGRLTIRSKTYAVRQGQQMKAQHAARPKRTASESAKTARAVTRIQRAQQVVRPPIPPERYEEVDEGIDFTSRVGILDLGANTCRFPVSKPWEPPYEFCGAPVAAEQVYCEHHYAKAYRAAGSAA